MNRPRRSASRATIAERLKAFVAVAPFAAATSVILAAGPAVAQGVKVTIGETPEPTSGALIAFFIFAALAVIGAGATILNRNPVVASLCLVGTLFSMGGVFLLLHATFLAAIQVLVYAGAIMVLFVFVVMSVGHPEREELGLMRGFLPKVVGVVAVAWLTTRLARLLWHSDQPRPVEVANNFGDVRHVGQLLFQDYLFPFEAISFLLLAAIVGAVMVSRRGAPDADHEDYRG